MEKLGSMSIHTVYVYMQENEVHAEDLHVHAKKFKLYLYFG